MRPNDKKNYDRTEWEKIKSNGKGKYLIHQARSGIVMGVFFGIIMHIFESGFELVGNS